MTQKTRHKSKTKNSISEKSTFNVFCNNVIYMYIVFVFSHFLFVFSEM